MFHVLAQFPYSKSESYCVKSVRIRSYSGSHFPTFELHIQSECGKMRTRITPITDTFHAVLELDYHDQKVASWVAEQLKT